MKILVISEHYFPKKGGSVTYVHNLCRSLSEVGCDVYLVTVPNDKDPTNKWHKENKFNVYCLDIPKRWRKERYFSRFLKRRWNEIIDYSNPDIIHVGHGFFVPLFMKSNLKSLGVPVCWTIQNVPPFEHSLSYFRKIKIIRGILETMYLFLADMYGRYALKKSHYDVLICVSRKTAIEALNRGVPKDKISVIPNGVNTNIFSPVPDKDIVRKELNIPTNRRIVLTVAGIIPHKGLDYLVRGAEHVVKKHPNTQFLIVGAIRSENYYNELLDLIEELKLEENVKIIPGVIYSEISKYYSTADIYILPSLEEGRNISILEAMSSELPVIGTETSLRFGENVPSIKIDEKNVNHISAQVNFLLENEEFAKELGERARRYVEKNYSWKSVARETCRIYESLQ